MAIKIKTYLHDDGTGVVTLYPNHEDLFQEISIHITMDFGSQPTIDLNWAGHGSRPKEWARTYSQGLAKACDVAESIERFFKRHKSMENAKYLLLNHLQNSFEFLTQDDCDAYNEKVRLARR